MINRLDGPGVPFSSDYDVGGDADEPGLAQPITTDDLDALAHSARGTVEERREALRGALDELEARRSMDVSHDVDGVIAYGRDLLKSLWGTSPVSSVETGDPEGFGFAPEDRLDQPDEILERAQDSVKEEGAERE
ncbi:hypothetical protein [Afifella sp. H1R]|uniref:hypothetical protein n=1 Tax=unclassified Afifella TaxID=2624128 RepID=UPI001F1EB5AB|nr:hypothetical protein [Afifella sp. H1R]MCF1503351.1 hypothetical protein [Afifella sp. H1R]